MTIKEVEQCLNVPRATVRFYEKEGLLSPVRNDNGYREYSEDDIKLLKKIIILRKMGFAVSDVEDVLAGAKPMSEALENNMENLTRQMQELQGAMALCRKMQENGEQIETFDEEKYWNAVEEEERKGNRFLDIAKDVVRFEKTTVLEFFNIEHSDGKPLVDMVGVMKKIVRFVLLAGVLYCLWEWEWSVQNFGRAVKWVLIYLVIEIIVAVPTYFILKKYPKTNKERVRRLLAWGVLTVLLVALVVTWLI